VNPVIQLWQLEPSALPAQATTASITYVTTKIVLVGEQGVGKTGLGWRLAHHEFKEHASTHGQQFWHVDELSGPRADGTQCEAILWDLAGQPDYRLIHALFVEDADVALVLYDPTADDEPLRGVEYWLRQLGVLGAGDARGPRYGRDILLVAARSDRGTSRLTAEELNEFCAKRGIKGHVTTSARTGQGLDEVVKRVRELIRWENRTTTVTTSTFKRVRDYILRIKEERHVEHVIVRPEDLRVRLLDDLTNGNFVDNELVGIVGHLANHGYVTRLVTSYGEPVILLAPDLLNNVAASMVLAARCNPFGLGALEENRLRSDSNDFVEMEGLSAAERAILLDSAVTLFLKHNICFRETDQLTSRTYLVFPQLINLKKPDDFNESIEVDVSYTVSGAVENLYASLVVRLGYTSLFTRVNQWHNHARYVFGDHLVCGFRMTTEAPGILNFNLYFDKAVDAPVRMLFQGIFESFVARTNVTFVRHEVLRCGDGHLINRAVIRERRNMRENYLHCSACGIRVALPLEDDQDIKRSRRANAYVQQRDAVKRSRFEQSLYLLKSYVVRDKLHIPDCFISYAWGDPEQERWVERKLAEDLVKAGVHVVLDRWENARIGASVPRFVERVARTSRVIVVGTPGWRHKYDNDEPMGAFVAASEGDLIGHRMLGTEESKLSVLPILLVGKEAESFPPLLQGRVYADFRDQNHYFDKMLDLLVSIYQIPHRHPLIAELRDLLGVSPEI
jgi:small GTP-binding protein